MILTLIEFDANFNLQLVQRWGCSRSITFTCTKGCNIDFLLICKGANETHGHRREHVELMTSCNEWVGFNPEIVAKAHYVKVF